MPQTVTNSGPHIIEIDRRRNISSRTLDAGSLARLESALRSAKWWQDRYVAREFISALLSVHQSISSGGLAVLAAEVGFSAPSPFVEPFEPIQLGRRDPQLRVLSGADNTKQEKQMLVVGWVLTVVGLGVAIWLAVAYLMGRGRHFGLIFAILFVATPAVCGLVVALQTLGKRWYLVPSGVAIIGGRGPDGRQRLEMCTRLNSVPVFRMVSTGKTTILMVEMLRIDGRRFRKAVSEREALSLLAAWQSPLDPPPAEQLAELAS